MGDPADDQAKAFSKGLSLHRPVYRHMRSVRAVLTGFGFAAGLVESPSLG